MFLDLISIIGVCRSCISAESSTVSTFVKLDFHFPTHYLSSTLSRVTAAIFTFRPKRLSIMMPQEMEQLDVRIVHIQITSPCLFNLIMKTIQAKLIHQWLMTKNNHFWKPSCFFYFFFMLLFIDPQSIPQAKSPTTSDRVSLLSQQGDVIAQRNQEETRHFVSAYYYL